MRPSFSFVSTWFERLREDLRALAAAGELHLARDVAELPVPELVEKAARLLGTYHTTPVVERAQGALVVSHPNLLHYYSNRLVGYGLEAAREPVRRAS